MYKTADDRQTHLHHGVDVDGGSVEAVKQTTGRMVLRHEPQLHPQTNIYPQTSTAVYSDSVALRQLSFSLTEGAILKYIHECCI